MSHRWARKVHSECPINRRQLFQASLAGLIASTVRAGDGRRPRILLRSSWQVVNIGDIAHTPGVLALIEKHIPEAEVILWASYDFSEEVAAMEKRRFPGLTDHVLLTPDRLVQESRFSSGCNVVVNFRQKPWRDKRGFSVASLSFKYFAASARCHLQTTCGSQR